MIEIPEKVYLYSDVEGLYPNELAWSPIDWGDSIASYVRAEMHTLVACTVCGKGVRNQYSVGGMCPTCAEAELKRLSKKILEIREDRRLEWDAIVDPLRERCKDAEAELKRLRGIEAATMHGLEDYEDPRDAAAVWWRTKADLHEPTSFVADIYSAIAAALEVKP